MRARTGARAGRTGTKAPAEGRYVGKVDGHPAVFAVAGDVVYATWFGPPNRGDFALRSQAWDVDDGRFEALVGGEVVSCSIAARSRT
jgi:hypothetical protein